MHTICARHTRCDHPNPNIMDQTYTLSLSSIKSQVNVHGRCSPWHSRSCVFQRIQSLTIMTTSVMKRGELETFQDWRAPTSCSVLAPSTVAAPMTDPQRAGMRIDGNAASPWRAYAT